MKRICALLLCVILSTTLFGCGSGGTRIEKQDSSNNGIIAIEKDNEESSKETEKVEEKKTFDADKIASQMKVVEYNMFGSYWNYHFVEVTNESEEVADIDVNILYYDADDKLISAESASEYVVEPGFSVLLYTMPDEKWSRTEITLEATEPRYYGPIQSDIELNVTPAKEKLVVQATNKGDDPAEFVQISALAFKGEEVVGYAWTYFTDNDSEIKPGKTISENLDFYGKGFDGYKIYVTGRRHK